jgi:hypothetical protein
VKSLACFSTILASAAVRVFLAGKFQCAQAAASSADLIARRGRQVRVSKLSLNSCAGKNYQLIIFKPSIAKFLIAASFVTSVTPSASA